MNNINEFIKYLNTSKTAFHACSNVEDILLKNNFTKLAENEKWNLKEGKYFVSRNNASIVAFTIPSKLLNKVLNSFSNVTTDGKRKVIIEEAKTKGSSKPKKEKASQYDYAHHGKRDKLESKKKQIEKTKSNKKKRK